jgi:hypothetical protein
MTVWRKDLENMPEGEDNWFLVRVGNYVPLVVCRGGEEFYDGDFFGEDPIRFVEGLEMMWTEIPL